MSDPLERPAYVCIDCGCVNEAAKNMIDNLLVERGQYEAELRGKRAQISKLKADQNRALNNDPLYGEAMVVLEHWKEVLAPNARELTGGDRLKNVLARLHSKWTVDELKLSATGYSLKPYVTNGRRSPHGAKDDWHADAELIYRNPQKVRQGIQIAEQADVLREAMKAPVSVAPSPNGGTHLSELGEAALRIARAGWMVFPIRPLGKAPASPNGLLDAKNAPDAIRRAWSSHPNLNIAIRTGKESGLVVLDVDGDEGWDSLHELENQYDELPDTLSVVTPRGGQHFYFQHPGVEIRNTTGYPGIALDIRGDGGYVLAPPSYVKDDEKDIDGAYTVDEQVPPAAMPKWLVKLLTERQVKEGMKAGFDWGGWITEGMKMGERDSRMTSYVGHMFAMGHNANEVFAHALVLNKAAVTPPMDKKQVEKIVKSIQKAEARKASK